MGVNLGSKPKKTIKCKTTNEWKTKNQPRDDSLKKILKFNILTLDVTEPSI